MILAIYSKYKPNSEWVLHSFAVSAEDAKKQRRQILKIAKEFGFDSPEAVIQSVSNAQDAPKFLTEPKPEKLIYN